MGRCQVSSDLELTLFILDLIYLDFRVKNKCAPEYGGYSTVGLGNVSNSVVNIKVWSLAINSARLDKSSESL